MKQEDKKLLLKDLSSRLPYKTYCLCELKKIVKEGNMKEKMRLEKMNNKKKKCNNNNKNKKRK